MSISRQSLFGKLTPVLFKALESATSLCKLRGNPHVELAHWINQILQAQDNDMIRLIRHFKPDQGNLERDCARALSALPAGASSISDFSAHLVDAVERAWVYSTLHFGDNRIRGGYLLAGLVLDPGLRLQLLSISPLFASFPVDGFLEQLPACIAGSPESNEKAADGSGLSIGMEPGYAAAPGDTDWSSPGHSASGSNLERFCTDLTERARTGNIDPVIGREQEIRSIIDILLRRRQNNPLLTGDAGVGKTAVVEGLALALARGTVPPDLKQVRLLTLSVGGLIAGAGMKGEFESRLRGLIDEVGKSPQPVVIFIDEIHTLVGAGGSQGTGDAANLLKPALARGAFRTIGATTWSEYKKHIEKDPALTRRFQVLQINEPDEERSIEMVRGLVDIFHEHHKVLITDEAVAASVRLSARYIPSRQLPDKAISLLDTACSRAALSLSAPPASVEQARRCLAARELERDLLEKELDVTVVPGQAKMERLSALREDITASAADLTVLESRWREQLDLAVRINASRTRFLAAREGTLEGEPFDPDQERAALGELEETLHSLQQEEQLVYPVVDSAVVAGIIADWTGIPVGRMLKDDMRAVLELPDFLARRIMGQDHVLKALAGRIRTSRAQLADPAKPVGVFLLVGPSGTGKTETALALAEALYGGEQNLITVNMSEFQEAHTVSTLKGAPPGYVGYGEGGVLTEAVRRRPHSVILLDEIEKAHQDVYELFYQVFDKGWMEDGEGRYIDFKNTVILLTTNIGSELTQSLCADPDLLPDSGSLAEALLPELRKMFPVAFLGRLTLIPFYPLTGDTLSRIVDLHLSRIRERLARQHTVRLEVDEHARDLIISRCNTAETGARLIIGFIEQSLLPEISGVWLENIGAVDPVTSITVTASDGGLVCRASASTLPAELDIGRPALMGKYTDPGSEALPASFSQQ